MTRTINIRHKYLHNWKLATSLALFASLLAFSSFSFSQNLVTNPGFENGTNGWELTGDASAQFTEPNGRSGNRLTHWSSSASYIAVTTQTVSGLTDGTYRLSAYTVGGTTTEATLWAACDDMVFHSPIPSSPWGSWTQVVVDDIGVSGVTSCDLGITTQDSEWTSIDDVVFEKVSDPGNAITVRASGTSGSESVSLQVGGTTVQTWTLGTSMQTYSAATDLDGEIRVAFTNDSSGRDVRVDYIVVNGATRQAEDQSTNTGVWQDGGCGGGGHSEVMHCNGYISFGDVVVIDDPSVIVIEEGTGFCSVDGSVDSNHAGYTGSGFANTNNVTGAGVDWKVEVPSSGLYDLEWRYANGASANRPGDVLINGSSVATVDFPVTGAWADWATASANIAMSAGENTIRLQGTTSGGLGNIDSMTVTGNSPQAVDCRGGDGYPLGNPPVPSAGCGMSPGLQSGTHWMTSAGLSRKYIVSLPDNYDANTPHRVVFGMHWANGSAEAVAGWSQWFGLKALDTQQNTIFVAPNGYNEWWSGSDDRDHIFFDDLNAHLASNLCIDKSRIFSVGFSLGAMYTNGLAQTHQDTLRGVVVYATADYNIYFPENTGEPLAYMGVHGLHDSTTPISSGRRSRDRFVANNGCATPSSVPEAWNGSSHVTYDYDCPDNFPVRWSTFDGGHSYPPNDEPIGSSWVHPLTWEFITQF